MIESSRIKEDKMFGKLIIFKRGANLDLDGAMRPALSVKGLSGRPGELSVKIVRADANFVEALSRKQLVIIELPRKEIRNG